MTAKLRSTALAIVALLGCLLGVQQAQAGIIIGDSVDVAVHAPTLGEVCFICGGITQVTVVEGDGDSIEPYLPGSGWFDVDINSTSIAITFNRDISWQSGDFIGLVVSGIDWLEGAITAIPGASLMVSGTNGPLPALSGANGGGRLSYTDTSVALNWEGLSIAAGTTLNVSLAAAPQATDPTPPPQAMPNPIDVSEPGFLVLLGGLAMLLFRQKKSLRQSFVQAA